MHKYMHNTKIPLQLDYINSFNVYLSVQTVALNDDHQYKLNVIMFVDS